MSQEPLRITVGPRWQLFTNQREGFQLIGTVQRGMQIGALAKMPDGDYAQVNGDIVETLNRSRVEFALRAATGTKPGEPIVNIPRAPSPAVVVTVKKKRRIVLPPSE
jgi:hypothetical protein